MIIEGNLFIDKGRNVFVQKRGAGRGEEARPSQRAFSTFYLAPGCSFVGTE